MIKRDYNKDLGPLPVEEFVDYYDPPLEYEKLPSHLKKDDVHAWRALNGIELIHKEPSLAELNRIWRNWNRMPNNLKRISDEKSLELFGMGNEDHYYSLLPLYVNASDENLIETLDLFRKYSLKNRLQEQFVDDFLGLLEEDFFESSDGFLIEIKEGDSWKFISLDNSSKGYNTVSKAHIFTCKSLEAVRKLQIIKRLAKDGFSEANKNLRIEASRNSRK